MSFKTRLAPTPSGYLHEGNLFAFALTWLQARKEGWNLVLRVDDQDRARYRMAYLEDIFRSLDFLGIDYDEGPQNVDDFEKNWSQVLRRDLYDEALKELKDQDQLFACNCSRKQILASNPKGDYPGTCLERNLDFAQESIAWRWKSPVAGAHMQLWTDEVQMHGLDSRLRNVILRNKEGQAAYQLCSIIDDQHFGISHIIRGQDLFDSSVCQLAIAQEMAWHSFLKIKFHHHPIIRQKGQKLSKSQAAPAAEIYRQPERLEGLLNRLSDYLHLPRGAQSLAELLKAII